MNFNIIGRRTENQCCAALNCFLPGQCRECDNEHPRGKRRGIVDLILSILSQKAAGNYTIKEIKSRGQE
jgi:hypothetical protein